MKAFTRLLKLYAFIFAFNIALVTAAIFADAGLPGVAFASGFSVMLLALAEFCSMRHILGATFQKALGEFIVLNAPLALAIAVTLIMRDSPAHPLLKIMALLAIYLPYAYWRLPSVFTPQMSLEQQ